MSDVFQSIEPIRLKLDRLATPEPYRGRKIGLYAARGKRAMDIAGSTVLLIAFAPLIIVIAAIVALDGGSPFYVQRRAGLRGRPFGCLKLRSMVRNSDERLAEVLATDPEAAREWRAHQKLRHDPRITPVGRFLRASSLDELPQLLNVFCGHMSLVGPRPVTDAELERYGTAATAVLSTRPGMTGYWQVFGRSTDITYDERVQMDLRYTQRINLRSDTLLLIMTALVVFRRTGT